MTEILTMFMYHPWPGKTARPSVLAGTSKQHKSASLQSELAPTIGSSDVKVSLILILWVRSCAEHLCSMGDFIVEPKKVVSCHVGRADENHAQGAADVCDRLTWKSFRDPVEGGVDSRV